MDLKREHYIAEISQAMDDDDFLASLIEGIHPKRQARETREMASQVLQILAQDAPARLFPYRDTFYEYLESKNAFSKMVCVYCIAGLVLAGIEDTFTQHIGQYMAMLEDPSVMIASHCALNAGMIAKLYPEYEPFITDKFLQIENSQHTESRKALITAYIIEAFETYAKSSAQWDSINAFIWQQMESPSPKAREAAMHYLSHFELK